MSTGIEIQGTCEPGFTRVRDAFAANFTDGKEVGASFALAIEGEIVVDLWGGFADAARTRPWRADTLINTYSTTKGMAASVVGVLADEGLIDYDAKVADYWPEFAAAGKKAVTVAQLLSHQAGICGPRERVEMADLYDWDRLCAMLAAQWPFFEPGTANGYHAVVFGHLAGEVARRVTGRTKSLGQLFAEKVAGPIGAGTDYYIGLPASEDHRVAEMLPVIGSEQLGTGLGGKQRMSDALYCAMAHPPLTAHIANDRAWRAAEVPGANGQGNGRGIAKVYGALANGGELGGKRIISAKGITEMTREECFRKDEVIGVRMRWSRGFILNKAELYGPNPDAFGHSGWGGSFGFADTKARLGMGYAMNQMDTNIFGDPRGVRLIEAAYGCLPNR
ncbi:MAG: serine hydrolase domain-containing protein [Porticoccaceae bacterium]